MEIRELKNLILSNKIPHFLVFVAEEHTLAKQYIEKISSTLGLSYKYYHSFESAIRSGDFSGNKNLCVVYNDNTIKTELKTDNLPSDGYFILLYDKDCFSVNFTMNNVVKFPKIDRISVAAYLNKVLSNNKASIDQEKMLQFVDRYGCNVGKCLNELDKVFSVMDDDAERVFDYMYKFGFSDYQTTSAEQIAEKIIASDSTVLNDIKIYSDSPITVLLILYSKARWVFTQHRNTKFLRIMKDCYSTYKAILSGKISDRYALQYLVVRNI